MTEDATPGRAIARSADYDRIAQVYDRDGLRSKDFDPRLVQFLEEVGREDLRILDIGCGTGNQLIANLARYPDLRSIGVDRSAGMLARAQAKGAAIAWVLADATALPLRSRSVEYASMQFAGVSGTQLAVTGGAQR